MMGEGHTAAWQSATGEGSARTPETDSGMMGEGHTAAWQSATGEGSAPTPETVSPRINYLPHFGTVALIGL